MSLAPFLAAPALVQIHAGAALAALGLGTALMLGRKGTRPHRLTGWVWAVLMSLVALSSLAIVSSRPWIGTFGWIHGLSALTLVTLPLAVLHARRHRIANHRWAMRSLFFGGLVVTGLFTLVPGRLMHQVLFGG
jgi:uncharacterized membrane protein